MDPHPTRRWTHGQVWLFVGVMLLAAATRVQTFNRPFERDPEGCGSFYGLLARNYLRWGVFEHYAVPIQSVGVRTDSTPTYYPNHPSLLPLLIAGTYALAGWDARGGAIPFDWLTRLPTNAFTLACVATIFVMLRTRAGPRAATIASVLFTVAPITLLFGAQPEVISTQLVFFVLLTVAAYSRFHDEPSVKNLLILCLAFAPAAATDWPAFYLVPVLGLHFVLTHHARRWAWIVAFALLTAVFFALLYSQVVGVTGDWQWMKRLVVRRALSSEADNRDAITLVRWINEALLGHATRLHTPVMLILALAWLPLASSRRLLHDHPATRPIALMLGWSALHVLVGRQGVFVHEWWWWPLTAGAAMAAGVVVDQILLWLQRQRIPASITNAAIVLLLCAFAFHYGRPVVRELSRFRGINPGEFDYSITEMGEAIRAAAPRNRAVMLAEHDDTLSLWFYGDRPIKWQVWDPVTFRARLRDGYCDSPFKLTEPWPEAPVGFVLPKAYLSSVAPLHDFLVANYPMRDIGKFLIFDLQSKR
jgi:hypothetical protein